MFYGLSFSYITILISLSCALVAIPSAPKDMPRTSLKIKSSLFKNNSVCSGSPCFFSHLGLRILVSTYTIVVLIPNVSSS